MSPSIITSKNFHYNLWRAWFSYWLGLPIPAPSPGAQPLSRLCECGCAFDPYGDHLLCCGKRTNAAAARCGGHNLIARALALLAYQGGLKATDKQGDIRRAKRRCDDGERVADIQVLFKVPNTRVPGMACATYQGFMGDVTLTSAREGASVDTDQWGTWSPGAMRTRELAKCNSYNQIYANEGFAFVALVANTCSRLSPTLLRFIQFLAEQQADHALQHECLDDNPKEIRKLFANRGQALVSCTVAIATAMRIVTSVRDGPDVRRWRSLPSTSIDHCSDVPLFPY